MTEVWALPGYDVQALIGYGATGEVWRARELATGATVALKRLRDGADLAAVESLRREASVLRSLDTPYVVRLRAMLGDGADTVLVLDLATGGSLAALLTRRGSLDPGEVVTIAAPLAQALAAAHACGLVHGDVTPANILFTAEGMPLLADLGLARLAGAAVAGADGTAEYVDPAVASGGEPDEAADVWALAAVCHHMLSGTPPHDGDTVDRVLDAARAGSRAPLGLLAPSAPRALVSAIERALQPDPALRPDALAFASSLRRAHAAAPVRLSAALPAVGPEQRPTHVVHQAPAPAPEVEVGLGRRRIAIAVAAVTLVVGAAAAGWVSGRTEPVQLSSVPVPVTVARPAAAEPAGLKQAGSEPLAGQPVGSKPAAAPDWRAVLDSLDRRRSEAFAAGEPAALGAIYAPGSPLLTADRAAMAQLTSASRRARGLRHRIRAALLVSYDGRLAVVRSTDDLAAFDLVDASGQVVEHSPPRPAASFVVKLVRTPAGWRLTEITPS